VRKRNENHAQHGAEIERNKGACVSFILWKKLDKANDVLEGVILADMMN